MKRLLYLVLALLPVMAQADLLDDITAGKFKPQRLEESTPMADGEHYAMLKDGMVLAYSYKTGAVTDTLFNIAHTKNKKIESIDGFILSPVDRFVLVYNNSHRQFRRSFTADYYLYDRKRGELKALSDTMPVRDPVFSPNGEYIAFCRDNNLYIHKVVYGTEVAVTRDGEPDKIFNGAADWLYEEEFGITAMYAFSPDSKQLAFVRLNETEVPLFRWIDYLDEEGKGLRYPEVKQLRYPKAGDKNAVASACVYDTYYKSVKTIQLPEQSDSYIPRIGWTNPTTDNPQGEMVILRMNRNQNKMEVFYANPKSTLSQRFYTEESKQYFVNYELFDEWQWLSDNSVLVVSEEDGYRHVYKYSASGSKKQLLTKGNFDVTALYGYDEATGMLYYQAADKNPMTRYIYQLNVKKGTVKALSKGEGMHQAVFSNKLTYFVDYFQSAENPGQYTLYTRDGKMVRELKNNNAVLARAKAAGLPVKQFFSFVTPRGDTLNGWMLRPADFSEANRYPVLMMQYSGPTSQQVLNRWRIDWEEYLAAKEGVVCVCVDGRGTDARGRAFRNATYSQLGIREAEDQVAAALWLGQQAWVDASRIAIWGWSYGGFETLMSMSICSMEPKLTGKMCFNNNAGSSPFRCGIAVAPVTDWRLYDSGYTERFMQRPEWNEEGYDASALPQLAQHLQGRVLIVHGLADDNVHVQNAFLYMEALVREGKQFEMQIYPDDNHFLRKRSNYNHLYHRMLDFLRAQLLN